MCPRMWYTEVDGQASNIRAQTRGEGGPAVMRELLAAVLPLQQQLQQEVAPAREGADR